MVGTVHSSVALLAPPCWKALCQKRNGLFLLQNNLIEVQKLLGDLSGSLRQ